MVLLNAVDQEVIVQKIESVVLIESSALKLCDGRINKKKKTHLILPKENLFVTIFGHSSDY